MVRETGLEPVHLAVLEPKSSASANSATLAFSIACCIAYNIMEKNKNAICNNLASWDSYDLFCARHAKCREKNIIVV